MSQTETIMYVALGFVLATLIALFVGRAMWVIALKASKRRGVRQRPSDLARAQADRDQLRAEYAMLSRKLELRLSDLKTRLAEQTAEVSRNRNRIEHLVAEIGARDTALAAASADLDEAKAQIEPLEAELAHRTQSLQKLKDQVRDRDEAVTGLHQELAEAHTLIAQRECQIEVLRAEAPVPAVSARSDDAEDISAYERLSRRIEELNLLSQRIESQRSDLSREHQALKALKADITLPEKPRRQRRAGTNGSKAAPAPAAATAAEAGEDEAARRLEMEIKEAERETEGLSRELAELDRLWNERLASLDDEPPLKAARAAGEPAAPPPETASALPEQSRATGDGSNIISLATRIRALKKTIGD